jgi:hypothetical protein
VIALFPGYPFLSLVVMALLFGVASKLLFNGTVMFSLVATPSDDDNRKLARNLIVVLAMGVTCYVFAAMTHIMTASW